MTGEKTGKYYFYFGMLCFIVLTLFVFQPMYSDELPHTQQIEKFVSGDYSLVYYLTTIPGYEAIIASVIKLFQYAHLFEGASILNISRMITLLILFFGLIPVFYNLSKKNLMRTGQFVLFSPIFTFLFLVYTDLMSMMFILIGFYYVKEKQWELSGIVFGLSLLIRQNNIVWLGFAMAYIFMEHIWNYFKWYSLTTKIKIILKTYFTFFCAIACFAIFVFFNKGMVLGTDKVNHVAGIYVGNIWWLGFLLFFTQFPLMFGNAEKIWNYIVNNKRIIGILFGICCIMLALFTNKHIYNTYPGFVRNIILHWVFLSPINMMLALIPTMYFLLYVLSEKTEKLFWFFSILVLIPSELVETRYCLIPIAFWMLSRKEQKKSIEYLQLGYSVLISIVFLWGILNWKVFW